MAGRFLIATASLALVAACSSTAGLDETPEQARTPTGLTGPQRNLLLSDMSYGSPGAGRAINETFDLIVTTFSVETDNEGDRFPNGAGVLGLVQNSTSSEGFSDGNTLEYFADTDTFVFNIETDTRSFNRSVTHVLLDDPADAGIENARVSKLLASNPTTGFQSDGTPIGFADGIRALLNNNNPGAISDPRSISQFINELTRLEESGSQDENDLYADIVDASERFMQSSDQFAYGYSYGTGVGYFEATNQTGPGTLETETVAIGGFAELDDNGQESYGYFVYGHRTPIGEMPLTGVANYEGKLVGSVLTNNSVRSLTGSVFMDVNFAGGLIDFSILTSIREGANNEGGTTFLPYKDLEGSGVLSDTIFSGDIFEINGDSTGEFQGGFFGPVANEAGGTFRFGNAFSYAAGAFTAAQGQ